MKRKNLLQQIKSRLSRPPRKESLSSRVVKLEKENRELKQFLRDFLTPKSKSGKLLPNGCSRESYFVRYHIFEKDPGESECPFIACKQWMDSPEYANCSMIALSEAKRVGGWDEKKIASVMGTPRNMDPQVEIALESEKALHKLRSVIKKGDI
jgi:hypothetical protein